MLLTRVGSKLNRPTVVTSNNVCLHARNTRACTWLKEGMVAHERLRYQTKLGWPGKYYIIGDEGHRVPTLINLEYATVSIVQIPCFPRVDEWTPLLF